MNINETELSELEELQGAYSDVFKDVNGFRPRFTPDHCINSADWLKTELDSLYEQLKDIIALSEENEKRAIQEFEALVDKTIAMGAGNRTTALQWIMDGSNCDDNWELLCYDYGLPYRYFSLSGIV